MKNKTKLSLILLVWMLGGCGSGGERDKTSGLTPNETLNTKTVLFEAALPADLSQIIVKRQLEGFLKGQDSLGKAVGALGPVAAQSEGDLYRFVFSGISSSLNPQMNFTVEVLEGQDDLPRECRVIAKLTKGLSFIQDEVRVSGSPEEFSLTPDCDGDGLSNLVEFSLGLRVDLADSDGDRVRDDQDLFPLDASEAFDQDEDGIGDNRDNCRFVANASQANSDLDSEGDACDLSTLDSDGDSIMNDRDNCPTAANRNQINSDWDLFGDACDCGPTDGNRYPTAPDEPDADGVDSNCDGVDGDVQRAVFVSNGRGSDYNAGTQAAPVRSLSAALTKALETDKDIYVERGHYNIAGVQWSAGVRLFGGYKPRDLADGSTVYFGDRCVYPRGTCYETYLFNQNAAQIIRIDSLPGSFLLDGFTIGNFDPIAAASDASAVLFRNVTARIQHSLLFAPPVITAPSTTALTVEGATSQVIVEKSFMEGGGYETTPNTTAVLINEADNVTLNHNIINAGMGRNSTAIRVVGASPRLLNNTLQAPTSWYSEGMVAGTQARALSLLNAANIRLAQNAFILKNAANRYGIYCEGVEPGPAEITSNLFAAFNREGSSASGVPRSRSCLGELDFLASPELDLGLNMASGNLDYPADRGISVFYDQAPYTPRIVDPEYSQLGAQL